MPSLRQKIAAAIVSLAAFVVSTNISFHLMDSYRTTTYSEIFSVVSVVLLLIFVFSLGSIAWGVLRRLGRDAPANADIQAAKEKPPLPRADGTIPDFSAGLTQPVRFSTIAGVVDSVDRWSSTETWTNNTIIGDNTGYIVIPSQHSKTTNWQRIWVAASDGRKTPVVSEVNFGVVAGHTVTAIAARHGSVPAQYTALINHSSGLYNYMAPRLDVKCFDFNRAAAYFGLAVSVLSPIVFALVGAVLTGLFSVGLAYLISAKEVAPVWGWVAFITVVLYFVNFGNWSKYIKGLDGAYEAHVRSVASSITPPSVTGVRATEAAARHATRETVT